MKTSTPCFAINAASVIFVTIPPVVSCAAIENSTVSRQMNQCLILYLFTVLFKKTSNHENFLIHYHHMHPIPCY